jgi:hypothetical protein
MVTPSMCSGPGDNHQPRLPEDIAHQVALAEAYAIRCETLAELLSIIGTEDRASPRCRDLLISQLEDASILCREQIAKLARTLDIEIADVDLLASEIETEWGKS